MSHPEPITINTGALDLTPEQLVIARAGIEPRGLTPTETLIVAALLPAGRLASREALVLAVWHIAPRGQDTEQDGRMLRVNLARLRPKLEARGWRLITRWGFGWRLVKDAANG